MSPVDIQRNGEGRVERPCGPDLIQELIARVRRDGGSRCCMPCVMSRCKDLGFVLSEMGATGGF